jgi:nitroreductase
MTFLDLARARRSVREYLATPVERSKIEPCLEAARLAPSACNSQPWRFIVIDDPATRAAVAGKTFDALISFNKFATRAPVLVAVVAEGPNLAAKVGGALKGKPFELIDIGMAVEHFCLQATEEGLGTCILGWFDERGIRQLLGIPRRKRIVLLVTVGYSKHEEARVKERKNINEIRNYNAY